VPLPSSVRYEDEWFYARNIARSAPPFIGRELTSAKECQSRTDAVLKSEVDCLLAAVETLKQRGLSVARLVHVFMHLLIQSLMACQKPMYQYSSVNDHDHHSFTPLALSKIEARMKAIIALPLGFFMDEDSSHPLWKNIVHDLVGFLLLVFFTLFPFIFFHFDVGFAGD
jgi:hypothetical protein